MKKAIHVKEYTRKKHGRAKFGGKVRSHNKSGRAKSGRFIRGVPADPQLLNQLRAIIGSKVKVRGDFPPVQYTLKDIGVTETGQVEAVIEDQYGTDVVDGKMIIKVKSGRAKVKSGREMKSELQTLAHQINAKELAFAKFKLSYDNDNNTIGLIKGQKAMRIKYNRGSDLYDITTMKFKGIGTVTEEKEHTGYYADMLKPFIQDFFNFEYVMHHFVRD